jgi:enterochelin esterase family protein
MRSAPRLLPARTLPSRPSRTIPRRASGRGWSPPRANPVFDHADVSRAELTRLEGSELWTICLRLPTALRASYRIALQPDDEEPSWRAVTGRRPVILAAMAASAPDERCRVRVHGSGGRISSVGAGPAAPADPLVESSSRSARGATTPVELPDDERAWVYAPAGGHTDTPLLVLFDGDVWRHEIPAMMDAAIAAGVLPPIHVAMLDAHDADRRWERLGTPRGQVDVVLDDLLPRVRHGWPVSTRGEDVIVSGQSLGGIAALWTVALGDGQVGHAIAQSPSLWRFDIADALLAASGWRSLRLQAGSFEGDMLADAEALAQRLAGDARVANRRVELESSVGGHDWAVWRTDLLRALVAHPWEPRPPRDELARFGARLV